jgi:hypothetical protein
MNDARCVLFGVRYSRADPSCRLSGGECNLIFVAWTLTAVEWRVNIGESTLDMLE